MTNPHLLVLLWYLLYLLVLFTCKLTVTCDGLLCTAVGGCSVAVFLHWLYDWLVSAALCLAK